MVEAMKFTGIANNCKSYSSVEAWLGNPCIQNKSQVVMHSLVVEHTLGIKLIALLQPLINPLCQSPTMQRLWASKAGGRAMNLYWQVRFKTLCQYGAICCELGITEGMECNGMLRRTQQLLLRIACHVMCAAGWRGPCTFDCLGALIQANCCLINVIRHDLNFFQGWLVSPSCQIMAPSRMH